MLDVWARDFTESSVTLWWSSNVLARVNRGGADSSLVLSPQRVPLVSLTNFSITNGARSVARGVSLAPLAPHAAKWRLGTAGVPSLLEADVWNDAAGMHIAHVTVTDAAPFSPLSPEFTLFLPNGERGGVVLYQSVTLASLTSGYTGIDGARRFPQGAASFGHALGVAADALAGARVAASFAATPQPLIASLLTPKVTELPFPHSTIPTRDPVVVPRGGTRAYPISAQPNYGSIVNEWIADRTTLTDAENEHVDNLLSITNRSVAVRFHTNYTQVLEDAIRRKIATPSSPTDIRKLLMKMAVMQDFVDFVTKGMELVEEPNLVLEFSSALTFIDALVLPPM